MALPTVEIICSSLNLQDWFTNAISSELKNVPKSWESTTTNFVKIIATSRIAM